MESIEIKKILHKFEYIATKIKMSVKLYYIYIILYKNFTVY